MITPRGNKFNISLTGVISVDYLPKLIYTKIGKQVMVCLTQRWTGRQREAVYDYIINGENQRAAAARLNISQSAVHKLLAKADYYSYRNAMDTVSQALKNIKVE